jgi:NitT/TauT family transport system substrate-binding protein
MGFRETVSALALSLAVGSVAHVPARAGEIVVSLYGVGMMGVAAAVALDQGYYKEQGLDITGVVGAPGGGAAVRSLLANPIPYGEIATSAAIAAHKAGVPLVIVNSVSSAADNVWVTMPDSKVESIKDLVGKRAAFTTPKSISEAFLRRVLVSAGIADQVKMVPGGGISEGLTMLEHGNVDTALIVEPQNSLHKGRYKPLFAVRDVLPPMLSVVGATTREYASKNPDTIRKLIAARRKAVDFIYDHPEQSGRIMAAAYHIAPDAAVEAVTKMAKVGYWFRGDFDVSLLESMAENMRLTGELTGEIDWKTLIDSSFLPDDLKKPRTDAPR